MTPSQQAKREGLKSLTQVSNMTGQSLQTLSNWAKDKTKLFNVVLIGCKAIAEKEDELTSKHNAKRLNTTIS